jgi:hypothetical protein
MSGNGQRDPDGANNVRRGRPDQDGCLILHDDCLVAVLVCLSDAHGAEAGSWFYEAGFGALDGPDHPSFPILMRPRTTCSPASPRRRLSGPKGRIIRTPDKCTRVAQESAIRRRCGRVLLGNLTHVNAPLAMS